MTSRSSAAASAAKLGYRSSHSSYFGRTRSTCVCCSMISETSTRYGSRVRRHGRSRPWRPYHVSSRRRNHCLRCGWGVGRPFLRRRVLTTGVIIGDDQPVRIYTKTGDKGDTALFDGTRVSKDDPRVSAYGEVDELNAWLGLARA